MSEDRKVTFNATAVAKSDALNALSREDQMTGLKKEFKTLREDIDFNGLKFDTKTLPIDMQRVYTNLKRDFGEEYALLWIFSVRTAVELHRAWHMTLLTGKILQQIKEKFNMRMTWDLGVFKNIFRVEDGGYELHRKVPYDYDSEFQDLYYKIATALISGKIDVHQALIFQSETKKGWHTAKSGLFFRDVPGRLVLYPIEAATCTVIFFSGDWQDAGVAALCGFVAGLVEWLAGSTFGEHKLLTDIIVGTATGAIGSLFYRFHDPTYCLSGIFLGTLYWFFYGTAFVIGILEIVAGELQTGVTRFIAVSIKTFVLTLGATFGMKLVLNNPYDIWFESNDSCGKIELDDVWWRIPLYLACSASALGQYRFPVLHYWRGLLVQLAGYEVQYQTFKYWQKQHPADFLDTASSNVSGAVAAVVTASALAWIVDWLMSYYNARLLHRGGSQEFSKFGEVVYKFTSFCIRAGNFLRLGRESDKMFLDMQAKLKQNRQELNDPNHARSEIRLSPKEETAFVEAIVGAEDINIWSMLMPAVYQLVPGSIIAKLWFESIFPPLDDTGDNVFSALMVISTSLAVGLLVGFAVVRFCEVFIEKVMSPCSESTVHSKQYSIFKDASDLDPHSIRELDPKDVAFLADVEKAE